MRPAYRYAILAFFKLSLSGQVQRLQANTAQLNGMIGDVSTPVSCYSLALIGRGGPAFAWENLRLHNLGRLSGAAQSCSRFRP